MNAQVEVTKMTSFRDIRECSVENSFTQKNKRLDAENKAEDNISPLCKFPCPVFCALQEGQTFLRKGTVELENMQEKKYHQSVFEASFGHKESYTLTTKTDEPVLEAFCLINSEARESRHIQRANIITGNDTFLNAVLFSLIPPGLKIPRKHF